MKLLIAGNIMNVLDVISTEINLRLFPQAIQYESNPVMKYTMENGIWYIAILFKIITLFLFTFWYYKTFKDTAPMHTKFALIFIIGWFGVCCVSNVASLIYGMVML